MRFAFISTMHGSPWGGSEELWSQAASLLKRAGHDVHAFVVYWPRLSDKVTALTKQGIRLETHSSSRAEPARRIWNKISLKNRRSFASLKRFNPDLVIISQGYNAGGFEWAKCCRDASVPYVMIVQCNSEHWWFENPFFADAVASYVGANKVFCVSRSNLDLLCLQLGKRLVNGDVVFNPYNVSVEPPPAWPDEGGGWRFACVARMDPASKGQDLLLQVLARAEWRDRPVELNFFGAGPFDMELRRIAEMLKLENVHFRGHVANIREIWQGNHLLILPSRYEGLPLALVEAMWCGRPAVVTNVGGNAELCLDGATGFVAPAPTLSSFSDTMERAWRQREEWRRFGEAGRVRVEEQISKEPIELFCEQLKACIRKPDASAST